MRRHYVDVPFEVKQFDGETGEFTGSLSVFNNVDAGGDIVLPGAFKDSLAEHRKDGTMPKLLWQHDSWEPIGVWTRMEETRKGLEVDGQLNLSRDSGQADVPVAWKARALMLQSAIDGMSIGYQTVKQNYDNETEVREIVTAKLWEGSIVTFPMNSEARVDAIKGHLRCGEVPSRTEFVTLLRKGAGFTHNQAERVALHGFRGLTPRKQGGPGSGNPRQGEPTEAELTALIERTNQLAEKMRS